VDPEPLSEPTAEERHAAIQLLAYRIWQDTGEQPGHDLENWLSAEALYDPNNPPTYIRC